MDILTVLNTAVGLMSLFLGGFSIWLALQFYTKGKDAEKEVAKALEAIKAQSDALQRLTARWMDRFTRHATEPKPADEGMLALVTAVAELPATILTQLGGRAQETQGGPLPTQEVLLQEAIDGYVGLYYYSALANVAAQGLLPPETDFDPTNELHAGLQAIVDRSASDFQYMSNVLARVDATRLAASRLRHLLDETIQQWRPYVRFTSQVFESRRSTTP